MKEFDIGEMLEGIIGEDGDIYVDLDEDLKVSNDIFKEWEKHPKLVGIYTRLTALAEFDVKQKKAKYKEEEAKAILKYSGTGTAPQVAAKATKNKKVKLALRRYHEAAKRNIIISEWFENIKFQRRKNLEVKTDRYYVEGYSDRQRDRRISKIANETGKQLRKRLKF